MKLFSPSLLLPLTCLAPLLGAQSPPAAPAWTTVETVGNPHPRHEAAFVAVGGKFHLLGGRRIQPVDIYDPATRTWTAGSPPPVEVHHFQPVVRDKKIWLVGAMTGRYPREQALDHIPIYDPATDSWSRGPSLPEERRRGGAGAVIHQDKLYVVCGIINGHWDGHVAWLDAYDFSTGEWHRLPDAPRARDHFQAAVIGDRLYVAGGRRSSAATREVFSLLEPGVDVFDITARRWSTLEAPLPTPRAGTASIAVDGRLIVAGGETWLQPTAHSEVERFDPATGQWDLLPPLAHGRHGTGLVWYAGALHIASGCGNRGGNPELDSMERLLLAPDYAGADIIGLVFEEHGGLVAVEAEHFFRQEAAEVRAWHLFTPKLRPEIEPYADGSHVLGAGGGAYLEVLPDTRRTRDDQLVRGENFCDEPGLMAVLSYRVHFQTPGRYYFWARTFSTGTEDNGLHVGLDGAWPESGRRWQTVKKRAWAWDSRQRTAKVHTGVPGLLFLDVPAGEHVVQISMREDGVELDKWLLTTDPDYQPDGFGPEPRVRSGRLPPTQEAGADYQETGGPPTPPAPPSVMH